MSAEGGGGGGEARADGDGSGPWGSGDAQPPNGGAARPRESDGPAAQAACANGIPAPSGCLGGARTLSSGGACAQPLLGTPAPPERAVLLLGTAAACRSGSPAAARLLEARAELSVRKALFWASAGLPPPSDLGGEVDPAPALLFGGPPAEAPPLSVLPPRAPPASPAGPSPAHSALHSAVQSPSARSLSRLAQLAEARARAAEEADASAAERIRGELERLWQQLCDGAAAARPEPDSPPAPPAPRSVLSRSSDSDASPPLPAVSRETSGAIDHLFSGAPARGAAEPPAAARGTLPQRRRLNRRTSSRSVSSAVSHSPLGAAEHGDAVPPVRERRVSLNPAPAPVRAAAVLSPPSESSLSHQSPYGTPPGRHRGPRQPRFQRFPSELQEPLLGVTSRSLHSLPSPRHGSPGGSEYGSPAGADVSEAWASDDDAFSFRGGWAQGQMEQEEASESERFSLPAADAAPQDCQSRARRVIYSVPYQISLLILLIADVGVVIALIVLEGRTAGEPDPQKRALHMTALIDIGVFCAELAFRAWATPLRTFCCSQQHRWWNIAETAALAISFVFELAHFVAAERAWTNTETAAVAILRFARVLFVLRGRMMAAASITELKVSAARHRHREGGVELDLTYITDNIIATSWPSSGMERVYRNSIEAVGRFLDGKHTGQYRVFNLCAERAYPVHHFHGSVERVMIDDHQPCDLRMLRRFCERAEKWLSGGDQRVIVVHCKGGKGRTGLAICAYLLWSGQAATASQAMRRFGEKRTAPGATKVQTVECPSQRRYLSHFETCVRRGREVPSGPTLRLVTVRVGPLPRHAAWPSDLCLIILGGSRGEVLWCSDPSRLGPSPVGAARRQNSATGIAAHLPRRPSVYPGAAAAAQCGSYTVTLTHTGGRVSSLAQAAEEGEYTSAEFYERFERSRDADAAAGRELWVCYTISPPCLVRGDFRLHFVCQATPDSNWNTDSVWWSWLHTAFLDPPSVHLSRAQIDGPHKDHGRTRFASAFCMSLRFDTGAHRPSCDYGDGDVSMFNVTARGQRLESQAPLLTVTSDDSPAGRPQL
eukprot:TRINITY_DN23702_c0_g1_i1.p1 TRINITY_DN23702_c0_g1~~TRINITY_DN23702_c0_g1_i1.p1  ORF type:complete len:1058 (+),score=234.88 TRINITY_DN23702_c0_g1_i1:100-3273(+)